MSKLLILTILFLVPMCALGYRLSLNSALQGALLTRKTACRVSELCVVALLLGLTWWRAPSYLTMAIPPVVLLAWILFRQGSKRFNKHHPIQENTAAAVDELRETAQNTAILVFTCAGMLFLAMTVACRIPELRRRLEPTPGDSALLHGLLLALLTLLIILLLSQLRWFRLHPTERSGESKERQELLHALHSQNSLL